MKIALIPIDDRPVCYSLPMDIISVDDDIDLLVPERKFLGNLTKNADRDYLIEWLGNLPVVDYIILSLDTLVYGGLIPSRRSKDTFQELFSRLVKIKNILKLKDAKILAFSSIMRISNNNYNEEEKEYWSLYGKKIFEYSFKLHKGENVNSIDIPEDILTDYLTTRKRNFEINKTFLSWQKEDIFDTLIFSKDDCAEFGFNVKEAQELEKFGGFTKTGADEIPLTLLARAISKDVNVYIEYTEPECKDLISNYEDVSIEKSLLGQLELAKIKVVENKKDADVIIIVNNFKEKQGELVMGWETKLYDGKFVSPEKSYVIVDVRNANGGDNNFVKQLIPQINMSYFYGYSGWNTSANTIGTLLATLKARFKPVKYNEECFKRLQMIRFLDDWAYQANVRAKIAQPQDISFYMKEYENILSKSLSYEIKDTIKYIYPWNRKFEVEVII